MILNPKGVKNAQNATIISRIFSTFLLVLHPKGVTNSIVSSFLAINRLLFWLQVPQMLIFFQFFWPIINCHFESKRCHKYSRPHKRDHNIEHFFDFLFGILNPKGVTTNIFWGFWLIIYRNFNLSCQKSLKPFIQLLRLIIKSNFEPKRCHKCRTRL